jgi:hypothetical protein
MRVTTGRAATLLLAIASISTLASGCQTTASTSDASRAALDGFLDFYFHGYRTGLPDASERAALAPNASPAFNAALEQAARAERCAYAQHQGAEPPLLQGDVFSSLFEKANGVQSIAAVRADADHAEYQVGFEYRMPGAARPEVEWQDTVQLIRAGNAWLVDDVIRGGNWDFGAKGSVRSQLLAVAALCATP